MELVGTFNGKELKEGIDKKKIEEMKIKNPALKYAVTKYVKKKKEIVGLKVYLMTSEEYINSNII